MFDLEQVFRHVVRDKDDLHDYQKYAVNWLYENPYSALYAGTGLGKTIIVLTLLDRLLMEGFNAKILIAAPIRVVNTVWGNEIARWRHTAWLSSTILRVEDDNPRLIAEKNRLMADLKPKLAHMINRQEAAKVKQSLIGEALTDLKNRLRRRLLKSRSLIHLINHESIDWLVDYYVTQRKPWPYRILVWDESSKLRDHNSNVFNAIKEMRPYMDRVYELTATPSKQSYRYFFSQIYLLDRGERFGRGVTAFNDRYFTQNKYSRAWTIRPGGAEEIERKIADIVLVMRKDDYSDLQKPTINIRPVFLSDQVKNKYRDFEATAILETPEEGIIEAQSAGILNNKLLQLASGAVYDSVRDVHFFHEAKFDELEQLLDETLDEPVLCSYWFKSTLARLKKRFPKAAVMDNQGKMVIPWNKQKFKLMLIHPASAAHGIELQHGGHHLAVFDLFHSAELFEQLIGRLDRQGQVEPVTVHLLSAMGTVDNTVARKLRVLEDAQTAMYRRLQRLHRKLRK